ncbi:uncharacterized protein LOC121940465, partial [Plectropomus leopardus]|uniref:uncharacterized protein LOC121940465 n=1 Tax=Plectropomus leopardus TaxID=160734 RepID=UPI001C4D2747
FPLSDPDRLKKWLANVRRKNWYPTTSSRLCSNHFEEHHFYLDSKGKRRLKNFAVPNIFTFPPHLMRKKQLTRATKGKIAIPFVTPCPLPSYLIQPYKTPGTVAHLLSVWDRKAVIIPDNGDPEPKNDIVIRNVQAAAADGVVEYNTRAEPERVMHDHDYLATCGFTKKRINVRTIHNYSVSPSAVTRDENAAQDQVVSESPSTPQQNENTEDQPVSESPSTPQRKDNTVQVDLVSMSTITLKTKENALRHKLVLARKKLKLKCQQTRRMKAKLLSLKALTKVLQKKMIAYEKRIAVMSLQESCTKCERVRNRLLS